MNDASQLPDPRTLAIDIGGTHLKASVLATTGRMIEQPNRVIRQSRPSRTRWLTR